MSKFERMQQNFADTMKLDDSIKSNSCSKSASSLKECAANGRRFKSNEIVCFGSGRNINEALAACENQESFTCILCQQEENTREDTSPMILLCYTQK